MMIIKPTTTSRKFQSNQQSSFFFCFKSCTYIYYTITTTNKIILYNLNISLSLFLSRQTITRCNQRYDISFTLVLPPLPSFLGLFVLVIVLVSGGFSSKNDVTDRSNNSNIHICTHIVRRYSRKNVRIIIL